jgi:HSP20 family molecular chaperone IbpA
MAQRDWENWMWLQAESLLSEAEKIRWSFLESAAAARSDPLYGHPSWGPAVNVIETEEAFWVTAAIPGVEAEAIEIRIDDGWLILSGRRALPAEQQQGRPHIYEIPSGDFERRVRLPDGCRLEVGEKSLAQGLLSIELRKLG